MQAWEHLARMKPHIPKGPAAGQTSTDQQGRHSSLLADAFPMGKSCYHVVLSAVLEHCPKKEGHGIDTTGFRNEGIPTEILFDSPTTAELWTEVSSGI